MSEIHLITGGTSGLGLASVRRLVATSNGLIVAGVRNPDRAYAFKHAVPPERLALLQLDTSSVERVKSFASEVKGVLHGRKINSILCVAGLQILGPQTFAADGIDETFATNVLGHILMIDELRDDLAPDAVVVTIGSGTHDPNNKLAARAGFMGADYTTAQAAAKGLSTRPDRDERGQALDRYATSKLCMIYYAQAAATDPAFQDARIYCLDPGLMPGTGLARQQNALVRFVWKRVLPILPRFVEGVSSPERSAKFLVDELVLGPPRYPSGAHIEFTGDPAPASLQANDLDAARRFLSDVREISRTM